MIEFDENDIEVSNAFKERRKQLENYALIHSKQYKKELSQTQEAILLFKDQHISYKKLCKDVLQFPLLHSYSFILFDLKQTFPDMKPNKLRWVLISYKVFPFNLIYLGLSTLFIIFFYTFNKLISIDLLLNIAVCGLITVILFINWLKMYDFSLNLKEKQYRE